jgi:hypothetical protein
MIRHLNNLDHTTIPQFDPTWHVEALGGKARDRTTR